MSEASARRLLSAVAEWRPEALVYFEAVLADLTHADALLPTVVEYRSCLLNENAIDSPHLAEWFEDRFVDAQRECVLNHVHLWDVAVQYSDEAKADGLTQRLRSLLPVLAEFWRWRLSQQTALALEVWTSDDPEEYGPTIGYGLSR